MKQTSNPFLIGDGAICVDILGLSLADGLEIGRRYTIDDIDESRVRVAGRWFFFARFEPIMTGSSGQKH